VCVCVWEREIERKSERENAWMVNKWRLIDFFGHGGCNQPVCNFLKVDDVFAFVLVFLSENEVWNAQEKKTETKMLKKNIACKKRAKFLSKIFDFHSRLLFVCSTRIPIKTWRHFLSPLINAHRFLNLLFCFNISVRYLNRILARSAFLNLFL